MTERADLALARHALEFGLLNQERLAHIDELRLIHNDIEQVS